MRLFFTRVLTLILVAVVISSCANRGTPSGGEIDTEPPIITSEKPNNFSTNFKAKEIVIRFNEYIKIKDLRKQLIISPPMAYEPIITPASGASDYITIKIKDTLKANTTYAFNFGESIVDNNEENPYPYYRYVFSTGNTIDSLTVQGYIKDALLKEPDTFVSVMLYEVDSAYSDSIVYKEKPRYITNTLDSVTNFSVDNIKAGTYKLIALKDNNSNFKFNQKKEKIAFVDTFITVPKDTSYSLNLFKEKVNFKALKPKQEGQYKIAFPYEGNYETMRINVLGDTPEDYKTRIVKDTKTDTLYYWYKPKFKVDTTFFVVKNETFIDTFKHRFRTFDADSLVLKTVSSGSLNFEDDFTIEANIPLSKIDTTKIKLINQDSTAIAYNVVYDSLYNRYKFPIKKEDEGQRYSIKLLPGAITDFYEGINKDTLDYTFRTKSKSEFGNIRVNLINAKFPLIVQLVDKEGEVMYQKYVTKLPKVDFFDLLPKQYDLRVIYDTNANGKYDTGNYLLGIQPERVSYAPKIDEVRANFDNIIEFVLLD